MLYVTKRVEFSSSHRLFNPTFSDELNEETFDKCNNINGHGHNYVLDVTVAGMPDDATGYVIDLKYLKKLITDELVNLVDHKHLNYDVDFIRGYIPTVENLSVLFWRILENKLNNCKLHKITLYETPASYVEYFGDKVELKRYEQLN